MSDTHGRLAGRCGLKLSVSRDGHLLFVGDAVPDALVARLIDAVERSPRAAAPDLEPPVLAACCAILEPACGPIAVRAGPYYVFGPDVRAHELATVVRSDCGDADLLRARNPGNWAAREWSDLLDGALGPWAMALHDGQVVSICHTPRPLTERAAECGVWTHPEFRGRGLAAEVAAVWAEILRPSGRVLFYSTNRENIASRRVAARLELREIGWTWNLEPTAPGLCHSRRA